MKTIIIKTNNASQTIAQTTVVTKDGKPTIIKDQSRVNYELIDQATGHAPDHIMTCTSLLKKMATSPILSSKTTILILTHHWLAWQKMATIITISLTQVKQRILLLNWHQAISKDKS